MADKRYLQKRDNCWCVRVPSPPRFWQVSGEFVRTLRTPDLKTAQRLRNKYVLPLLAETAAADMLATLQRLQGGVRESVSGQLSELRRGLSGRDTRLTLREAGEQFVKYLSPSGGYSPSALHKYAASIDVACRILDADADLEALSKADVVRLRDTLLSTPVAWQQRRDGAVPAGPDERTVSARSVGHHLMNLRRLFKWCIDEGRLERKDNPCDGVAVARMAPKTRRAPTVAEVDALVALPKARPIDADAWRLMPLFARHTGARAGEIAQLRAEDVVVEQGIRCFRITAREGDRRLETVSSERLVPVASKLQPHLDELLAKQPAGTLLDAGDWKATSCPI